MRWKNYSEIFDGKIECFFVSRWLERFFDGEVGRWRSGVVQSHAGRCGRCRARLKEMIDLRSALRLAAVPAPGPPEADELWARLSSRIPRPSDASVSHLWLARLWRMLIPQRLVWVPAALALLVAAGVGVVWDDISSTPEKSNAVIIDYIESSDSSFMIVQPENPGDMTVIWIFEDAKRGPSA